MLVSFTVVLSCFTLVTVKHSNTHICDQRTKQNTTEDEIIQLYLLDSMTFYIRVTVEKIRVEWLFLNTDILTLWRLNVRRHFNSLQVSRENFAIYTEANFQRIIDVCLYVFCFYIYPTIFHWLHFSTIIKIWLRWQNKCFASHERARTF